MNHRSDSAWERLGRQSLLAETPSEVYRRLRMEMLVAERETFIRARDEGRVDDTVLREVLETLDIEESMLDQAAEERAEADNELRTPVATAGTCKHLAHEWKPVEPSADRTCQDCVDAGQTWVHLRMCLKCGNVGCCDSSSGKHATEHFRESLHPVLRSHEPGESWRWCFLDKQPG